MRAFSIVALLAALFFSLSSLALEVRSASTDTVNWLSLAEIHTRLESAGYRSIEKIEREGGRYEVKATDRAGQRVKLYVHPQTGEAINLRSREFAHDRSDAGQVGSRPRVSADCNERRCRDDLPPQGTPRSSSGK